MATEARGGCRHPVPRRFCLQDTAFGTKTIFNDRILKANEITYGHNQTIQT